MSDLTTLTTPERLGEGRFTVEVPTGWGQGRGAFGGYVVALLVRAMDAHGEGTPGRERSLRSLTATLCGPLRPGAALITVEALRIGSGVSSLAARLLQEGEVQAHAVGVYGRDREASLDFVAVTPPALPPWREVAPMPGQAPFVPEFTHHFEFRPLPPFPFSGGDEAKTLGWIRPRDPGPARDAAYLAALIDTWWPALLTRLPAPRPLATIAFTFQVVGGSAGLDPAAPLLLRATDVACRGGYVVEQRELWGEDGRLCALNQQTIVLIR